MQPKEIQMINTKNKQQSSDGQEFLREGLIYNYMLFEESSTFMIKKRPKQSGIMKEKFNFEYVKDKRGELITPNATYELNAADIQNRNVKSYYEIKYDEDYMPIFSSKTIDDELNEFMEWKKENGKSKHLKDDKQLKKSAMKDYSTYQQIQKTHVFYIQLMRIINSITIENKEKIISMLKKNYTKKSVKPNSVNSFTMNNMLCFKNNNYSIKSIQNFNEEEGEIIHSVLEQYIGCKNVITYKYLIITDSEEEKNNLIEHMKKSESKLVDKDFGWITRRYLLSQIENELNNLFNKQRNENCNYGIDGNQMVQNDSGLFYQTDASSPNDSIQSDGINPISNSSLFSNYQNFNPLPMPSYYQPMPAMNYYVYGNQDETYNDYSMSNVPNFKFFTFNRFM